MKRISATIVRLYTVVFFWVLSRATVYADPAPTATPYTGVLVKNVYPDSGFSGYVQAVLSENFPIIMLLALAMIVFSGVQYMASGFSPESSKQAKERIIGILAGLVFYLLISLILRTINGNFSWNVTPVTISPTPN